MMVEECYLLSQIAQNVRAKGEHVEHTADDIDNVRVVRDLYIYGGGVWEFVKINGMLTTIRQNAISKYFENL